MLIEAARRAEAAAREMLALVNAGEASCAEMREMLAVSKPTMAIISAAQAAAAASISGRERHGDGGAEVLAGAAGLSRQEARSHIKTAEALRDTPKLRDALESGRVSAVNAKRLAEAAGKTSASDVESDSELLAKAESLRPEQFTKEARRWTVDRQGDGGASEHARQRARRCVRVWDGDDGMVHLRGEFDAVTGRRIRNRLRADAGRLLDTDKKNANKHNADNNGTHGHSNDGHGRGGRRSFDQCMADALDNLTREAATGAGRAEPYADICVVAHVDEATGELIAQLPDGERLPPAVLEELACDARLTGVIYDRKGRPIWRTHPRRRPTDAQRQMLIARDGGCFACGTDPDLCDIHHVEPVAQGGPTSVDNLVLACWQHHNAIHHFGWQIHGPPGNRTLHPPEAEIHGPAHAPDQRLPPAAHTKAQPAPATAGNGTHHGTEPTDANSVTLRPGPADAGVPRVRSGPAAARVVLRSARPEPLFTPD
ncbi:MAG: DUF222 domain-containing protein [Acidimicrobiaceae bacterium]|nr:DUF222 domain-containing protein [Acidimicrobiaceae bacterium]